MKRSSIEKGIGCAAVLPAATIGWAGLGDGIGPTGWLGISEFIGWAVVCLAASFALAMALAQVRWARPLSYVPIALALAIIAAMTLRINWLGLGAPMAAKLAYTSSMQVIGTIASAGFVMWIGYFAFKIKESH